MVAMAAFCAPGAPAYRHELQATTQQQREQSDEQFLSGPAHRFLLPGWYRSCPAGCGLLNLGNSCFLNSVLQCLAHLPPLANICLMQTHSRDCALAAQDKSCVCCAVETQIARMLTKPPAAADAPRQLFNNLHVFNSGFARGAQEDAHELLRCLTDAMERNLLRQAAKLSGGGGGAQRGQQQQPPPRCPKTWVNALFQGILQSQVRCMSCGATSDSHDPCMDLSLELRGCSSLEECLQQFTAVEKLEGENMYRCDGCRQLVPARKQMSVWDDPNVLVVHLKRFDGIFGGKIDRFIKFPVTLSLEQYISSSRQVQPQQQQQWQGGGQGQQGYGQQQQYQQQRWQGLVPRNHGSTSSGYGNNANDSSSGGQWQQQGGYDAAAAATSNGRCSNGSSACGSDDGGSSVTSNGSSSSSSSCGANNMLQQQQAQQAQQAQRRTSPGEYVLSAVLVHSGYSARSGHYVAYVKDGEGKGFWHCMNDSSVYRVNLATVLNQSAYLLFYTRQTMKPQADLPAVQQQPAAAGAPPAVAAAAGGLPGRLKRASSETGGSSSSGLACSEAAGLAAAGARAAAARAAAARCLIGPQLPPHLMAKRQKRADAPDEEQQQRRPGDDGGRVYGPALPPHLQQQQQPDDEEPPEPSSFGPQLPPGWQPSGSSSAAAADANGTAAPHSSISGDGADIDAAAPLSPAGSAHLAACVEQQVRHAFAHGSSSRTELLHSLQALKQQGVSLAEGKAALLTPFRRHPAVMQVAQHAMAQLMAKFGCSSSSQAAE